MAIFWSGVKLSGVIVGVRIFIVCLFAAELAFGGASLASESGKTNELVERTGRVKQVAGSTNLLFKVEGGPAYKLRPSRDARALFEDNQLWAKTLVVKGKIHRKDNTFEVIVILHSLKNGKRYELYYFCDVCSIETSFPGLCLCCRAPVELREREEK